MKKHETMIEYSALGEQDDILKSEIEEILAKFNTANNTDFIYEGDEYYWGIRSEQDPDMVTHFEMAVVYDDEYMAIATSPEEEALANEVIDAMQKCSARHGFPESLRHSDYED